MNLELKHLAAYLPYGLKFYESEMERTSELVSLSMHEITLHDDEFGMLRLDITDRQIKPFLRPLSQLTEEIEHNGEWFVPMEEIDNYHNFSMLRTADLKTDPTRYPYTVVEALISWHFDVFGLIDQKLAVELKN